MRLVVGPLLHALSIALQLALLLCAVLAVGCSSSDTHGERPRARSDGPRAPSPLPSYEPIAVVNGGTITGMVTWAGALPELTETPVTTHREVCGATQRSPALSIGRRGGVARTVVWIEGIRQGRAAIVPEAPVGIELRGCAFEPHVVAVPVGTRLAFRNADGILHNVHASFWQGLRREESWFSEGLPQEGATHDVEITRPGIVRVVDDAGHPWMFGWIHAFEHPYYAVSDENGRFQIMSIPPGHYTLRAWHEGVHVTGETEAGRPAYSSPIILTRPVTVSTGHDTTVDFTISAEAAEAAGGQ